jgi:hypothetical protein
VNISETLFSNLLLEKGGNPFNIKTYCMYSRGYKNAPSAVNLAILYKYGKVISNSIFFLFKVDYCTNRSVV